MAIPNTLDPPNGDYVKYIENIQKGKIVPADGLAVPQESVHHHPMHDPVTATTANASGSTLTKASPQTKRTIKRLLGALAIVMGLSSIACGIVIGPEEFIPVGMFTLFGGFILVNHR